MGPSPPPLRGGGRGLKSQNFRVLLHFYVQFFQGLLVKLEPPLNLSPPPPLHLPMSALEGGRERVGTFSCLSGAEEKKSCTTLQYEIWKISPSSVYLHTPRWKKRY